MCRGCWECDDFPAEWTPTVARAVVLWRRLYDELGEPTGGPLHVHLDDYNLDYDEIVPSYSMPAYNGKPATDDGYPPEVHEVCDELAALLTAMTLTDRYTVMAYADAYHDVPGAAPLNAAEVQEDTHPRVGYPYVKVTHLPTGVSLFGRGGGSEEENRVRGWRMLRNRLAADALHVWRAG